ncbi:MAG: F-type H+-transporting ATPase subunit gamma [Gemmatimonadales bacterium]|jgi:F-type H+-transporting ATPase subunit gamma|nr:F-type H+-transporting ATPase subunit gamma [Gemmatimonadales bacterium]
MAKSRQLKGRIRSVQNTRKITKTMELVATSKLKRAQDRVIAARPYAEALRQVIADLYTPDLAESFPLLRKPAPPSKGGPSRAAVILLTSNRGLAGGFNSNLIKEARRRIESLEKDGYTVELLGIGKKGIGYFKYLGRKLALERVDIGDRPTTNHAGEIVEPLIQAFSAGELASVDLIQARFLSALQTPPATVRVLPVEAPAGRVPSGRDGSGAPAQENGKVGGMTANYILAPNAEAILDQLLPLYVRNAIYRGMVETAAAEHGARRTAMKNATDNAGDILELLKRTYNRQRQAQITQEIAEIVGGAAALQG